MVKIKFCGITSLKDAQNAIQAGADLLGFNFYTPSPRFISPQTCEKLLSRLGSSLQTARGWVQTVGIFVNLPAGAVRAILDSCGLDLAQFSGDETPEYLEVFGECSYKALRPAAQEDLIETCKRYPLRSAAPAFLVDAHAPGLYGGSGKTGDWRQAAVLAARHPMLLAGGLHPGNVAEAIRIVRPWGVDSASGIESSPGVKDKQKMEDFTAQVRLAELSIERQS